MLSVGPVEKNEFLNILDCLCVIQASIKVVTILSIKFSIDFKNV